VHLGLLLSHKYIKRFFFFEKQYIKRLDTRGQEPPTMMDSHYAVSPLIFKSNIAGSSPFLNISFSKVSSQYWRLCYDEYYLQSNKNKNINNNNNLFMFSLIIFGPYLTKVYLQIKLTGNLKTHTTYLILIKHVFNSVIASNNC